MEALISRDRYALTGQRNQVNLPGSCAPAGLRRELSDFPEAEAGLRLGLLLTPAARAIPDSRSGISSSMMVCINVLLQDEGRSGVSGLI